MMEHYFILKDGKLFAHFPEGSSSRFGQPFDYKIFLQEFNSCVNAWKKHSDVDPKRWSYRIEGIFEN